MRRTKAPKSVEAKRHSKGNAMLTRRDLLRSAVAVPAAAGPLSLFAIDSAQAQAIDLLKLFVPAAPGGGWDQTARTIEQVLRATGAVKGVQITNIGGAGGAVGLPQFLNQWKGQGNALMVAGMVMVGAIIANKSPVKLAQATPIARLTGEYLALVVPAQSSFKSAKDFAAALKADPSKVPVAGGSAGGSDHILLGMIAKAIGVAPTKVSYVAFAGGGPATAALVGNQVAAGISGYAEFAEQVKAGKLRLLAVSSDKRLEGIAAPTLKEEGIDVELANWRGVFAPPGVNDTQRKAMIALMEKMVATPQWAEACKTRDWVQITLLGDDYKTFLEAETARIEGTLKELGLA
jgi:putative tricarboxylic transport membrane protein